MNIEEGEIATPLVIECNGEYYAESSVTQRSRHSSYVNLTLIFSTLVAVCGSYVFGTSVSFVLSKFKISTFNMSLLVYDELCSWDIHLLLRPEL